MQGGLCFGEEPLDLVKDKLEIDHIIPRAKARMTRITNYACSLMDRLSLLCSVAHHFDFLAFTSVMMIVKAKPSPAIAASRKKIIAKPG